jgi:restriction system protein
MPRPTPKGPKFIQFFGPVLEALKELGGSGRPAEVKDVIVRRLRISEQDQSELLSSGGSRFSNQVDWARFYLSRAGYVDSSTRGVWSLTDLGSAATIDEQEAYAIFKRVRAELRTNEGDEPVEAGVELPHGDRTLRGEVPGKVSLDYRAQLLMVIGNLSPAGFERLCQRLLRESGFESVTITGRTGDGGIDGIGILQMTPFVSFKVLFQCKRYQGSVSAAQIRDFRGAMQGRTDKGIIITTGTFTSDARKEAVREGAIQVELVDGEKLVNMFEALQLGLKPKTGYDVDYSFFQDFG